MTTDVVLTVKLPDGRLVTIARTLKYVTELQDDRVLEKFDIKRELWEREGVDWGIVTERDVPEDLVRNIAWVWSYRTLAGFSKLTQHEIDHIAIALTRLVRERREPLRRVAAECDDLLGHAPGDSLQVARHLIASRQWLVDMHGEHLPQRRIVLLGTDLRAASDRGEERVG